MRRRTIYPSPPVLFVMLMVILAGANSGGGSFGSEGEINVPPTADAGPDQTVECNGSLLTAFKTPVSLDGSGSSDPDGDALSYLWLAPGVVFDDPSSPTPTGGFPLGTTTVTLNVSDGEFEDEDTVDITIEDTTPPGISVALNRDVLWPPNHKMANIRAAITVSYDCCPDPPTVVLTSVASNELDNGKGDGDTVDDIRGANVGARDTGFQLRSERSGRGDGRVYTIIYTAADCAGNEASDTVCVRVPHSQSLGHAFASMGFAPSGAELDPALDHFVLIIPSRPAKYAEGRKKKPVIVAEAFDATALNVEKTYVGNVKGVVVPERSLEIDINCDGLNDLALYYSTREANFLTRLPVLGDEGVVTEDGYGPVGLHYTSAEGVDYLVPDIFELGPPVPLVPSADLGRSGEAGDEGRWEGRLGEVSEVTALLPSYPNPFNPSTTIPFRLGTPERVTLAIYDARGALVRTLENEALPAGLHRAVWNGRDANNQPVATGVYFVRLDAGAHRTTQKIVLIK